MSKKEGYSREGLFGTVQHYDAKGHKIGESRPSFFGGYTNYDAKGHKVGESRPSLLGGYTNYDAKGHKTGSVSPGLLGGQTHYDAGGRPIGTSSPTILGGQTHGGNFGGSAGLINNAGAAAAIHRDEQAARTPVSPVPPGAAGGVKENMFNSSARKDRAVQSEPRAERTIAGNDGPAQSAAGSIPVCYIIASVPSRQANVSYRTEETDLRVGDQAVDADTGEQITVLAVVECLPDALPGDILSAGRAVRK